MFGNVTRALKEKKDQLRTAEDAAIQGGNVTGPEVKEGYKWSFN